jgi:hypothetical protein
MMAIETLMHIGDLHLWTDEQERNLLELIQEVERVNPDILVMDEVLDLWRRRLRDFPNLCVYQKLRGLVCRRHEAGKSTVYVKGNHDWSVKAEYMPYALLTNFYAVKVGRYNYHFYHGWEWDIAWGGWSGILFSGIHPIAFFIAKHFPQLMVPIYNCLFGRQSPGQTVPAQSAQDEMWNDWNLHVGIIHLRARQYAAKNRVRVLLGHTHCPTEFDGLIADHGDLSDRTYTLVTGESVIQLRYPMLN